MFIAVHDSFNKLNKEILLNVDHIHHVSESGGECIIETLYDDHYVVVESYEAIKAKLMPGFKANDGVAERLRRREEFFKGK